MIEVYEEEYFQSLVVVVAFTLRETGCQYDVSTTARLLEIISSKKEERGKKGAYSQRGKTNYSNVKVIALNK